MSFSSFTLFELKQMSTIINFLCTNIIIVQRNQVVSCMMQGCHWGPKSVTSVMAELACVADETKPRYSPSANQRLKACSAPRVLPGFSIIVAYGCSFVYRDWTSGSSWNHGYALDEYQIHNINTAAITELGRGIIKCKSFTEMLFGVANAMVCLFSLPLWTFG